MTAIPFVQPFSTSERPIPYVDALAQCQKCHQTSSYDSVDAYEQKALECHSCGGRLKLYQKVSDGTNP